MPDRGKNAGVSGLINYVQEGVVGVGPYTFNAALSAHGSALSNRVINRTGPASTTGAPVIRLADTRGTGTATGLLRFKDNPYPALIQYNTGTLTTKMGAGNTIDYPVRINGLQVSFNDEDQEDGKGEAWRVIFTWTLNGLPTLTWNGTTVTLTAPTANDLETFDGRSKTYDPHDLRTAATTCIDCQGVAALNST